MSNDLNTLNGALVEMKDQLIYELGEKGVTANYDSSTGLLGLISKIGDIQTDKYCIKFNQDTYTTYDGNVTLECTLYSNYLPLANETVTLTDGTSLYTSITNNNGIAIFNLSNISASKNYTCSYQNVSNDCEVIYQQYIFYDDCSSASGLTNYSASQSIVGSSTNTLTYSNSEYLLSGSGNYFSGRRLLALDGIDNAKLTIKFKLNTTSSGAFNQFLITCTDQTLPTSANIPYACRVRNDRLFQYFNMNSESTIYTHSVAYSTDWFYLEVIKNGTSWTINLYNSNNTLLATNTRTLSAISNPKWYFGLQTERGTNYSVHIKEIKAEPI